MNIHDKINIRALIAEYPRIGTEEFKARFRKLKIGDTGGLESNFRMTGKLEGNSAVVEIFYRYYGDFVHQGVGRGVSLEDVGIARMVGGGRKKKPWKKGIGHTRYRLAELYQEKLGEGLEQTVKDSMDKKLEYKLKL